MFEGAQSSFLILEVYTDLISNVSIRVWRERERESINLGKIDAKIKGAFIVGVEGPYDKMFN